MMISPNHAMMTSDSHFLRHGDEGQELDLAYIRYLTEMAQADLHMTIADVVPTNMKPTDSESRVAEQILGYSIDRWLNVNPWAKDTFGGTIKSVESIMDHSVSHKDQSGITHSVKMEFKAARALASVAYSGLVNASIGYQITTQTFGVEISREVGKDQKVVFNHTDQPSESREIVGYRFEW